MTAMTTSATLLRGRLTRLSPPMGAAFVASLSARERERLDTDWPVFVYAHQTPPACAAGGDPRSSHNSRVSLRSTRATAAVSALQPCHQTRRVPAPAAHLLDLRIELVD